MIKRLVLVITFSLLSQSSYAFCYNGPEYGMMGCWDKPTILSPADKLKIEQESYKDQLTKYIKKRDEWQKDIDTLSVRIKEFDDALSKLTK